MNPRIDIISGIGYGDGIDQAFDVLRGLAKGNARILKDPVAPVSVCELPGTSVNLGASFLVNTDNYWAVLFDMNKGIKQSLDGTDIENPFPRRVTEVKKADPAKPAPRSMAIWPRSHLATT